MNHNHYQHKNYNQKNSLDIIISRYQENTEWIDKLLEFDHIRYIFIYNKFYSEKDRSSSYKDTQKVKYIKLPNLGRESHTYLFHIINNFNNLNDANVFLQGDPFYHCTKLYDVLQSLHTSNINTIIPFAQVQQENENNASRKDKKHPHGLCMSYFMDLLFNIELDQEQTIQVNYGAQFCVSKKCILHRPIGFYKYLYTLVSHAINPIEGYILERLWLYIFNTDINISSYYTLWTNENLAINKLIDNLESDEEIKIIIDNNAKEWSSIRNKILSYSINTTQSMS